MGHLNVWKMHGLSFYMHGTDVAPLVGKMNTFSDKALLLCANCALNKFIARYLQEKV